LWVTQVDMAFARLALPFSSSRFRFVAVEMWVTRSEAETLSTSPPASVMLLPYFFPDSESRVDACFFQARINLLRAYSDTAFNLPPWPSPEKAAEVPAERGVLGYQVPRENAIQSHYEACFPGGRPIESLRRRKRVSRPFFSARAVICRPSMLCHSYPPSSRPHDGS